MIQHRKLFVILKRASLRAEDLCILASAVRMICAPLHRTMSGNSRLGCPAAKRRNRRNRKPRKIEIDSQVKNKTPGGWARPASLKKAVYWGRANATIASPKAVPSPGLPPNALATYSRPFTVYTIGAAVGAHAPGIDKPLNFHRMSPVSAFTP